jgi:hypothetical protein
VELGQTFGSGFRHRHELEIPSGGIGCMNDVHLRVIRIHMVTGNEYNMGIMPSRHQQVYELGVEPTRSSFCERPEFSCRKRESRHERTSS